MHREDFPILNQDLIYFDNGATTLKPYSMIEAVTDYYSNYTANAHRGDYDNSLKVDTKYEGTRKLVRDFIGAKSTREIVFTSGSTDSLNRIVFGYFKNYLKEGDEVLVTTSEHASNLLPWFELADMIGIKIKYIPLNDNQEVTIENVKKTITDRTKVISIAHITNVIGDIRPIKDIIELAHKNDILCVIDGAQSVPHIKVDVRDYDMDFLIFLAIKSGVQQVEELYNGKGR
jgi:cysteine desulfurase/selenocysteine lyase